MTCRARSSMLIILDLRRYALSTLVNTLRQSDAPIPFEFLINGSFLRTTLDEYLTTNGISSETTLAIEYVRASIPPRHLSTLEHPDWVSAVDVLSSTSVVSEHESGVTPGHERILSASYDGSLRVWNTSSQILAASSPASTVGYTSSLKAARFVGSKHVASGGYDRCLRIWKYIEDAHGFSASLQPHIVLYGHKAMIEAISVHPTSNRLLTASADHSLGFWSSKKSDAPPAPPARIPSSTGYTVKRRKVGPAISVPQRGPLSSLTSHTDVVSDVIFHPEHRTVAYSTSWDHSLKTWDLPTSTCVDTRSTSDSLFSLTTLSTLNLVAVGSSARHITLIDPRATATTVSAMTLRGHNNLVASLASNPTNPFSLVSGSHDGTCRIWDVRSAQSQKDGRVGRSTYVLERESATGRGKKEAGEGVKVFSVCWDQSVGIVSGSEDNMVQINKGDEAVEKNKD